MQLVYSALSPNAQPIASTARRQGYLAACMKHRETIAAIQQYLPGWLPPTPSNSSSLKWQ